ncbi:D-alanyl-D-alanine carboxypeptidase DacC [Candidatus Methylopumilus turicensis]|uniref:serine-type D-Ala-D-Ala carboxypeptidase n=2 Tax=Candidatus Methylopumilus turicensis TaxID=1581680 RepID=A0A0B7J288_9PROT|nr:D-alanyl-D-alanine carboxypeptidase DacC [Candidatus Methylopumilus turicensis]
MPTKETMTYFTSFFVLILSLFVGNAYAEVAPAPELAVKAYLLKDFNSNRVLAEQQSQSRVEPASLTKLMTAYLSFKALKNGQLQLDQTLPISEKAWRIEGSKMFVDTTMTVTVDELLHGMIIQSGNDASIALAEGIGGTEAAFATKMNQEAARLGMKNTHFMNATGLPDAQHYTTAYDLSLLATALIQDFPEQYKRLYSVKEYTYNKITQPNRNRLLWLDPNVDGMKTGHTESAGFCLISSAKRGEHRLISVVLGAANDNARATESQKLLNYGYQFFDAHLVYKAGATIATQKVWKGTESKLAATTFQDLYVTLPKGDYARAKAKVISKQPLIAPVAKGQEIGRIQFVIDEKVVDEQKLLAAKEVKVAGIFGRLWDSFMLLFA